MPDHYQQRRQGNNSNCNLRDIADQVRDNQSNQHEQEHLPELIRLLQADEPDIFDEINNDYLDKNEHRVANNAAAMNPEVSVADAA